MNRAVPAGNEAWQTTVVLCPPALTGCEPQPAIARSPLRNTTEPAGRALPELDEIVAIRVARWPATSGAGDTTKETALSP